MGGERILDRLVRVMTAALDEPPLLVANAAEAGDWRPELRVVPDVRPGLGSLGGIYTAVVEAPAPVVCVAWDMPFVSEALVRRLADGLLTHDACLPESGGRREVEPLCAAYGPACVEAIAAASTRETSAPSASMSASGSVSSPCPRSGGWAIRSCCSSM